MVHVPKWYITLYSKRKSCIISAMPTSHAIKYLRDLGLLPTFEVDPGTTEEIIERGARLYRSSPRPWRPRMAQDALTRARRNRFHRRKREQRRAVPR